MTVSLHILQEQTFFPIDERLCLETNSAEFWRKHLVEVSRVAENAQCFDMGDLRMHQRHRVVPELVRLPYPVCWFEGFAYRSDGKIVWSATLAREVGDRIELTFFWRRSNQVWECYGAAEFEPGKDVLFPVMCEPTFSEMSFAATVVAKFLSALNCCNVKMTPVEPPAKLQKARAKRGKSPMYRYWVLSIHLERSSPGARGCGSHASPAFHLRRGHSRKLASGRSIWVQTHSVGDVQNGIVAKSYRVH